MKQDNFVSSLLTLAIAILFPIVVYYFASIIAPVAESGSQFSRYTILPTDDSVIMFRSVVALLLAFIAFVVSLTSLRPHRELFRGLIGGSVTIVLISNLFVASNIDSSNRAIGFVIQWTSFILLYSVIHYASRNLPHIVLKQDVDTAKSPQENNPQHNENPKPIYPGDETIAKPESMPSHEDTATEHEQQEKKQNSDDS